jgi:hypothetical protein
VSKLDQFNNVAFCLERCSKDKQRVANAVAIQSKLVAAVALSSQSV